MTASFNPWRWVTGSTPRPTIALRPVEPPPEAVDHHLCTPEEFASHREAALNPR